MGKRILSTLMAIVMIISIVPIMSVEVAANSYNRNNVGEFLFRCDGQRSAFFNVGHVRCQGEGCSTTTFPFDPRLVTLLDTIRNHYNRDVVINQTGFSRGFRCEKHAREWGVWISGDGHLNGTAVDVSINGITNQAILNFARDRGANNVSYTNNPNGAGVGAGFAHIQINPSGIIINPTPTEWENFNPHRQMQSIASEAPLLIRSAPTTSASQVGSLSYGERVNVSAVTRNEINGHRWARIGDGRYVALTFLRDVTPPTPINWESFNPPRQMESFASDAPLRVRDAPSLNATQIGSLAYGERVSVSAVTQNEIDGHRWARIGDGRYVALTFLRDVTPPFTTTNTTPEIPAVVILPFQHQSENDTRSELVRAANSQIQLNSRIAANQNPYSRAVGTAQAEWCGDFVAWCLRQVGLASIVQYHGPNYAPNTPNTNAGWNFQNARLYADERNPHFSRVTVPQPGDIVVWLNHVAIVTVVEGNNITYVGGNQLGNADGRTVTRANHILGSAIGSNNEFIGYVRVNSFVTPDITTTPPNTTTETTTTQSEPATTTTSPIATTIPVTTTGLIDTTISTTTTVVTSSIANCENCGRLYDRCICTPLAECEDCGRIQCICIQPCDDCKRIPCICATITTTYTTVTTRTTTTAPPTTTTPTCVCKDCDNCGFIGGEYGFGKVAGGNSVTIGDALEILKFLAGIGNAISNSDGSYNPNALAAARITNPGSGNPTIGDALEILKQGFTAMESRLHYKGR
jgi:hypothetical protein